MPKIITTRRDELLVAAARLFARKGYHATSMQDIADALDILRGSLYHHIDGKEALLHELMERGITELLSQARPIARADMSPREKLVEIIRRHTVTIARYPDFMAVFLHELKSLSPERRREILTLRDEYDHIVRGIIEEGIERGDFRATNVRMATFGLLGLLNWIYQWYSPDGPLSPDEVADVFVDMVLHGLAEE